MKLPNTYEKYGNIHIPYQYKQVIQNLSKNNDIVIMKQDKVRGVVILDKPKYMEKWLAILNT